MMDSSNAAKRDSKTFQENKRREISRFCCRAVNVADNGPKARFFLWGRMGFVSGAREAGATGSGGQTVCRRQTGRSDRRKKIKGQKAGGSISQGKSVRRR